MKSIRKHISKFSLIMGLSMLLFSCSQYEDTNKPTETNSNLFKKNGAKYSGEEIFRGIFFMQNDISDGISEISKIKAIMLLNNDKDKIFNSLNSLSEISVNFIKTKYPTFFDDLNKAMYSGDLYQISDILNLSGKLIEQAGLSSDKTQAAFLFGQAVQVNEELRNQITQLDLSTQEGINQLNILIHDYTNSPNQTSSILCWAVVCVFYIAVAAVSIAAVAYSVYYKVAYWGPRVSSGRSNIFSSEGSIVIEREFFIKNVGVFFSNK